MHHRHLLALSLALAVGCNFTAPGRASGAADAARADVVARDAPRELVDAPMIDAPTGCDQAACAAAGGACAGAICAIDVTQNGAVYCPVGLSCVITCQGDMTCGAGIDCARSTCTVECLGDHSCSSDTIACSSESCTLDCIGNHACSDVLMTCASGGTCTFDCGANCGDSACNNTICVSSGSGACARGDCP